jgi:cell division septum initiation protein DivIVA
MQLRGWVPAGSPQPDSTGTARSATRPPRTRARRGRKARTLRALKRTVDTADAIDQAARARQQARAAGQANTARAKTTDLDHLYVEYRADKRDVYATGLVPEGQPFHRGGQQA